MILWKLFQEKNAEIRSVKEEIHEKLTKRSLFLYVQNLTCIQQYIGVELPVVKSRGIRFGASALGYLFRYFRYKANRSVSFTEIKVFTVQQLVHLFRSETNRCRHDFLNIIKDFIMAQQTTKKR